MIGTTNSNNFMPQSNWNQNDETAIDYIKNRPFYTSDPVETVILEEQMVTINEDGGHAQLPKSMPFETDKAYVVYFNGERYECVAYELWGTNVIGNGTILEATGGDNEPFLIASEYNELYTKNSGTYTISIFDCIYSIYKIDDKYLNNSNIVDGIGESSLQMNNCKAYGGDAFAEGYNTVALEDQSHAEGCSTIANLRSHAEGFGRITSLRLSGDVNSTTYTVYSMDTVRVRVGRIICYNNIYATITSYDGDETITTNRTLNPNDIFDSTSVELYLGGIASGRCSHVEGYYTTAASNYQHVQGQYNIIDNENIYAHIVGNGTSEYKESNAHTLDWDGNAWFAGDVYVGSTSGKNKDEGSKKLVTIDEVNAAIATAIGQVIGGSY